MRLVTRDEMRELDRSTIEDFGTPSLLLMERAGQGVLRAIRDRHPDLAGLVCLIVAGSGNNGGDGFVVARLLREHGADVTVMALAPAAELRPDARTMLARFEALGGRVHVLRGTAGHPAGHRRLAAAAEESDLIVDALFGTGFHGELNGLHSEVIAILNEARAGGAEVVAIDVPSGLDADTGAVPGGCIEADLTVTLGFAKVGCFLDPGREAVGELEVADLGIPDGAASLVPERYRLLAATEAAELLPPRSRTAHKGRFGRLVVIGGSAGFLGAAGMAGMAALRAGGGLVTIAVPESLEEALAARAAETMTLGLPETGRRTLSIRAVDQVLAAVAEADAVAIGPGLSREPETAELIRYLVGRIACPIVLDADGLNAFAGRLSELQAADGPMILTPHVGEMARLSGRDPVAVEAERLGFPSAVAAATGHVVLLKGSPSLVAAPGRAVVLCERGNPGMATAGAGDVLAGVILGFLGQGLEPYDAAAMGMVVHAAAGDRAADRLGEAGLVAGDILSEIPAVLRRLSTKRTWEVG
jgi:NAD(P)H-hydrate epimerase